MQATIEAARASDVPAAVPATDHAPGVLSRDPADHPVPTGREEQWRFTPLKRFGRLLSDEPSDAHLTWTTELSSGVTLEELSAQDVDLLTLPLPVDRISALALARSGGAVRIRVQADSGSEPVALLLHGEDAQSLVHGHVILDIAPFAEATIVLEHTGGAQYAEHLSVLVGDGATLRLVHLQSWEDDAVHSAHVAIRLGRDASLTSTQVSLGGHAVRVVETIEYAGPGGSAHMYGLFFANSGQHLEHRLFVDHSQPNCTSRVTYKGALQGVEGAEAHTVWVGDVLIRARAIGTDTYEINRNLVLSDHARADSVPNLEIETGEVTGAGHASATGRFDDEQLFYLQSRGIPSDEARRLVVRGFFHEILQQIGIDDLEARLVARVEAELEGHGV